MLTYIFGCKLDDWLALRDFSDDEEDDGEERNVAVATDDDWKPHSSASTLR